MKKQRNKIDRLHRASDRNSSSDPSSSSGRHTQKDAPATQQRRAFLHFSLVLRKLVATASLFGVVAFLVSASSSAESFLESGSSAFQKRNYQQALALLNRCLVIQPDSVAARRYKALCLLSLNRTDEALKHFNLVLQKQPCDVPSLEARAAIYSAQSEWQLVANDLERVVASRGDLDGEHWWLYGNALDNLANYKAACSAYEKAILKYASDNKADTTVCRLRMAMAVCLRKTGHPAEAAEQCSRILEHKPNDRAALVERAHDYVEVRDLARAEADLTELSNRFPEDPAVHFVRGQYLAAANDRSGAIREFDLVLKNKPDWAVIVSREIDKIPRL